MLLTNFPIIFPLAELRHLLSLDLAQVRTAQEYYAEKANFCFAIGCCTRYFARRLVAGDALDPLPEGVDFTAYVTELVERPGAEQTSEIFTSSEATYIVTYIDQLQGSLELPVTLPPAEEEQPAE